MPRFAILAHDWPVPHFDLLLEAGAVLKAWRLATEPRLGESVSAEPNFDHRLLYLDYEGAIAGNRGRVVRWDFGTFVGDISGPTWQIELAGQRLRGTATMTATQFTVTPRPNPSA